MKINNHNIQSIDLLKGICIMVVIVYHSFDFKSYYPIFYRLFFIEMALFYIIIGYNSYNSFNKINYSKLRNLLNKNYLIKRFKRYLVPFAIIYLLEFIIKLLFLKTYSITFEILIFKLPFDFEGNYFISILFHSILILPILFYFYKKAPKKTIIISIVISFSYFSIFVLYLNFKFYNWFIFYFLFFFIFGFYIREHFIIDNLLNFFKYNKKLLFFFILSFSYYLFHLLNFDLEIFNNISVITLFFKLFFHAIYLLYCCFAFIIILFSLSKIRYKRDIGLFRYIGLSSYHIFLLQGIYFGFFTFLCLSQNLLFYLLFFALFNLILITLMGILHYKIYNLKNKKEKLTQLSKEIRRFKKRND